MTVRAFSVAPLASRTSARPPGAAGRARPPSGAVDHVDVVGAHERFEFSGELRPLGVSDRDQVLDAERIESLAAEPLGDDAGADALARRVDRRGRAGRAAADDQHVVGRPGVQPLGVARRSAAVELGEDLLEAHASLPERLAVQEDGRDRHDLALRRLGRKRRAVDRDVADARVEDADRVQRLNDLGAVLAGLGEIGLEPVVALERLDLLDRLGRDLRRMAARLQEREHERVEFVAHRQAGEGDDGVLARRADREGGLARVVAVGDERDAVARARRSPAGAPASRARLRRRRARRRARSDAECARNSP